MSTIEAQTRAGSTLASTRGIITGLLLVLSVLTLTKALSEDIIVTQFSKVGDIIRSLYPTDDYLADNPDALRDDYDQLVGVLEGGAQMVLGLSERTQAIYDDMTAPKGYTVTSGAIQLYRSGDIAPAILILLFSVAMPILKTALMLFVYVEPLIAKGQHRGADIMRLLNLSHKYTMLDVFVVAITVFAFSEQALVSVKPAEALYWYLGYMAVSYGALWLLAIKDESQKRDKAQISEA